MIARETLSILTWILDTTLKGSIAIALGGVVIALVGKRLGARWRHALWLIVVARLALPFVPQTSWSPFNLLQLDRRADIVVPVGTNATLPRVVVHETVTPETVFYKSPGSAVWKVLLAFWLAGALLLVGRMLFASFRLHRIVRRATRQHEDDGSLARLVEGVRRQLGIRRHVRVISSDIVKTPALHGIFRPTLLLPSSLRQSFAGSELRHVVLHELWHLKRHDVGVNWLLSFVQAIHWFNPLVWFAVLRIREEREICCDELALSCLEEEERYGYGMTILRLLEMFRIAAPVPALVGIVNQKQQMKRRLMMIASFKSRTRFSLLFLGAVAFVGAVAFTDARGAEKHVMKMRHTMGAEDARLFDKRISLDLTNASFSDLLSAVATSGGVTIKQSPELATLPVQQAKFTLHATNVPVHMVLMHSLMPFQLAPKADDGGITIEKSESCAMGMRHVSVTEKHEDGKVEKHVVKIVTGDHDEVLTEDNEGEPAPAGAVEHRVRVQAMSSGSGDCKLGADGKLHNDITVKIDEDGTTSEGRLQLDIDAPPTK